MSHNVKKRYNDLGAFFKKKFGCRVYKVSLKADFTCPNRDGTKGYGGCIYCNPDILIPLTYFEEMSIKNQLTEGIAYIKKRHKSEKFIAYMHSYTNTYGPLEELEELYKEAVDSPDVVGLAISTRPDCINDDILDLLSGINKEKFLWVELGLQSSKNRTLDSINRGHSLDDFLKSYKMVVSRGIPVCVHVILGLPGETERDMMDTAKLLGKLEVWGVKIHHLEVQKDTELERMYQRGEVKMLSFEEYTYLVVQFIRHLYPKTLIHRLCSDTPIKYLVAPIWEGGKFSLLRKIEQIMEDGDVVQGEMWQDRDSYEMKHAK